jgi:hypothetical protein
MVSEPWIRVGQTREGPQSTSQLPFRNHFADPGQGPKSNARTLTVDVGKQRLCEVPDYVKLLPARQLFQELEAIIASHSFRTLQFLKLAHQRA